MTYEEANGTLNHLAFDMGVPPVGAAHELYGLIYYSYKDPHEALMIVLDPEAYASELFGQSTLTSLHFTQL